MTPVLGKANSDKDREIIQQDLHRVLNWSYMWQMPFNTKKEDTWPTYGVRRQEDQLWGAKKRGVEPGWMASSPVKPALGQSMQEELWKTTKKQPMYFW